MYCKDCKFYKKDSIEESGIIRGECNNNKLQYTDELKKDDELIYYDADDYHAALYVGELFGCIHFKEKENIQKLLRSINADLNILFGAVKHYKRIYEDKWINKSKYNSSQIMLMRMECDQLVHDCKKLLEEIEINESKI